MSRTRIGLTVTAVVVVGVAFVVWLRQRPSDPSGPVEVTQSQHSEVPGLTTPGTLAPETDGQITDLATRLAAETRARRRAEAEAAALHQTIAPLQTNVVVSFGTVEDMGRRAGAFLPSLNELQVLSGRDAGTLSPDEKRRLLELQRDHAQLLGALPEITRFQDNPDEYARFFRSMFEQAAGLSDAQAGQIESYMRERATAMNQAGLNAAREPTDPKLEEEWEERRDKFNEQTAEGLKTILPPGAAEKVGFGPELMEFLEMDFDKLSPPGRKPQ